MNLFSRTLRAAASAVVALIPLFAIGAQQHLTVYAAASLRDPFVEIGALLEKRQPGLKVDFNFGGSNALAQQIGQGAPADVFASADAKWMTFVTDSLHAGAGAKTFARNRLVVIVPHANPAHISRLQELTRSGVKIVVAADPVPVGQYTRDALAKLSAAPGFSADYATLVQRNVVSREENVKAVVAKVQLGEADAGFVYQSDVVPAIAGQVTAIPLPDAYNVIATYPIVALTAARNTAAARAFVALVLSDEGQRILARYNFAGMNSSSPVPH